MAEIPKSYRGGVYVATPPAVRQSANLGASAAATTAVRPVLSSTTVPGNCLVAFLTINSSYSNLNAAGGWTKIFEAPSGTSYHLACFVEANTAQATTTPTACATWTTSRYHGVVLLELTNVATASPVDVSKLVVETGNPSLTDLTNDVARPAQASEILVAGHAHYYSGEGWAVSSDGWSAVSELVGNGNYHSISTATRALGKEELPNVSFTRTTLNSYGGRARGLVGLKGIISTQARFATIGTVPAGKRFIINSIEIANNDGLPYTGLVHVANQSNVIYRADVVAHTTSKKVCYHVVDAGETLYWTGASNMGVIVSGLEVDVA